MKHVEVGGRRLEYVDHPAHREGQPVILMLHEGLGSVSLWRDFPERLAAVTGCRTIIWSRAGYGHSQPQSEPRTARYMHEEALRRCRPCSPHLPSSGRCCSATATAAASR